MTERATITRTQLARMIDHTLLTPEATVADVARLVREAGRLGVGAICVSPSRLPLSPGELAPGIGVASVVGFPSGAHLPSVKAAEAAAAVAAGATEIDMVIDLGRRARGPLGGGDSRGQAVRAAIGLDVVLKVILETAVIGPERIAAACRPPRAAAPASSRPPPDSTRPAAPLWKRWRPWPPQSADGSG